MSATHNSRRDLTETKGARPTMRHWESSGTDQRGA